MQLLDPVEKRFKDENARAKANKALLTFIGEYRSVAELMPDGPKHEVLYTPFLCTLLLKMKWIAYILLVIFLIFLLLSRYCFRTTYVSLSCFVFETFSYTLVLVEFL